MIPAGDSTIRALIGITAVIALVVLLLVSAPRFRPNHPAAFSRGEFFGRLGVIALVAGVEVRTSGVAWHWPPWIGQTAILVGLLWVAAGASLSLYDTRWRHR